MQDTYALTFTAPEREQLLVALEYARAMRLGEFDAARMLADLDAEQADALADRLFLAGAS